MWIEAAITQKHLEVNPQFLGIFLEIGTDKVRFKHIIPGRNRGVSGKDSAG